MDWFLADFHIREVKPKILKKHSNHNFHPKFSIQFRYFSPKKVEEITQYFTTATMPENKVIVWSTCDVYLWLLLL